LEYFKYKKATGALVPHIILLDLNMPLIDGVRALHRLREVSSFRDLPVIILSGNEDPAIPGNDFPSDANRKNESPFQYPVPGDSDMTP
jgi:CheY-like chemotaxis protein